MSITEILTKYQENMEETRKLNDSISDTSIKKEWQKALINRAERLQVLYKENNELLDMLNDINVNTIEDAKAVSEAAFSMYYGFFDDSEVLVPLFEKCVSYYEANNQDDKYTDDLVELYSALAYENTEYIYRVTGEESIVSVFHSKVFAYKDKYSKLMSPKSRYLFILNYYNNINAICDKAETVDASYKLYKEFLNFLYVEKNIDLFADDEKLHETIYATELSWLVADDVIEQATPETQRGFLDASERYFKREMEVNDNVILKVNSQVYIAYLHAKAMFGIISYEQAIESYLDYYFAKKNTIQIDEDITDESFYFLINGPISLERLLKHIEPRKRRYVMDRLDIIIENTWSKILRAKKELPFVNNTLALWCKSSLKYCNSRQAKERKILDLIVKRQITTYTHSYMVHLISQELFNSVYLKKPELFKSLNMSYEELKSYVESASLLHDIGKTKICDIITMVRRRLSNNEKNGIQKHPLFGAELIEDDNDLVIYRDVILGHHRYYDGSDGYPGGYDNTKAKYRIIVDIITIADCIDAATDNLGRNYKNAKDIETVMAEFVNEAGTRYNPDVVKIISKDRGLREILKRITQEDRLEIMYNACIQ